MEENFYFYKNEMLLIIWHIEDLKHPDFNLKIFIWTRTYGTDIIS